MSAAPADPGMKARMAMKPRQAASTAVGRRCRRTELPVVSSTQYLLRAPAGLAVGLAPKEWRYAGCDSPLSSWVPRSLAGLGGISAGHVSQRDAAATGLTIRRNESCASGVIQP